MNISTMSAILSTSEGTMKTTRKVTKRSTLKAYQSNNSGATLSITSNTSIVDGDAENSATRHKASKKESSARENVEEQSQLNENVSSTEDVQKILNSDCKKKLKSKQKKSETNKQNVSVNSNLNKFDALQKRNLIHVRSSDPCKAQEKFSKLQGYKEINCRLCTKPVYKMEEIMAEKKIYHKNCFRCHECNKQLKVDNYLSHEGILYCMVHFKLLFSPKCVEDSEPDIPRKPEMIVRENHPNELPSDVIRASDKPDLGLEELQQLNVRSIFQVFENAMKIQEEEHTEQSQRNAVKTSILSKIAKLKEQGITSDLSLKDYNDRKKQSGSDDYSSDSNNDTSHDNKESIEDRDSDRVHSEKSTQRERPVGLGHAMHEITTKFENDQVMPKEERREERKQEIQNIRSRLFMGKQARIKEMYQQAVAESGHGTTSSDKKPEIEIEGAARSLKERFESGEAFRDTQDFSAENVSSNAVLKSEADVFESAMSKKSRSIFMQLDAQNVADRKQIMSPKLPNSQLTKQHSSRTNRQNSENEPEIVVKYHEKPEDIETAVSDISSKFKFFETYRPPVQIRKQFRITPPREEVLKMPSSEFKTEASKNAGELDKEADVLEKSHTTAIMLSKFREIEQNRDDLQSSPRPLKCFTPPPDGGNRFYQDVDSSDLESQDENEEFEDDNKEANYDSSGERYKRQIDDEALKEAQATARAKQLRAKFEKWEANENERESDERRVDIYFNEVSDNLNIERTKTAFQTVFTGRTRGAEGAMGEN
ncbi:F-actin-monooxygenase Mical isoform X3 [Ceratitis capitata]|uniref:F-actin-monooxygenase Mical isoform X3 n=1 Tax=Ceratitis capitata TaxID=7213 RepID=UPI000A11D683|nr:F-actin-monooxygenase Mical isoform X3 [Ceratitis capitata]